MKIHCLRRTWRRASEALMRTQQKPPGSVLDHARSRATTVGQPRHVRRSHKRFVAKVEHYSPDFPRGGTRARKCDPRDQREDDDAERKRKCGNFVRRRFAGSSCYP
jgi:hypothetical protein